MKYKKAGVDIEGSQAVKKRIKELAPGIGHFSGLYDLGNNKVLAVSVDGVGAKLNIAQAMNQLDLVGADIVNHCVNDILCLGAKPAFFLDYIAQDKLREEDVLQLIRGMVFACQEAGMPFIGGETAQLPTIFRKNKFDLAGMIGGFADKDKIIDGSKITAGDIVFGLPSTGLHTNGYSLVSKIIKSEELNGPVGKALLQPHRSYLKPVSLLLSQGFGIHGIAHITGGGLAGNIIRILPENCQARIRVASWPILPVFQHLQEKGKISSREMYQVFNMGIGLALVVSRETFDRFFSFLWASREPCYLIGEIIEGAKEVKFYMEDRD